MAGFIPAIHVSFQWKLREDADARDKAGHDEKTGCSSRFDYAAVQPPSIDRLLPVIWAASSPQR